MLCPSDLILCAPRTCRGDQVDFSALGNRTKHNIIVALVRFCQRIVCIDHGCDIFPGCCFSRRETVTECLCLASSHFDASGRHLLQKDVSSIYIDIVREVKSDERGASILIADVLNAQFPGNHALRAVPGISAPLDQ